MTLSLWKGETPKLPRETTSAIMSEIAARHGVTLADIIGDRRFHRIICARHEAMWELHRNTGWSTTKIGRYLGGRDHSTVIHGVRAHEARVAEAAKVAT